MKINRNFSQLFWLVMVYLLWSVVVLHQPPSVSFSDLIDRHVYFHKNYQARRTRYNIMWSRLSVTYCR